MKYCHTFALKEKGTSYRLYQYEDWILRLDFISHILRVSLYHDENDLLPTYSICPGESVMPREGRKRLSLEGLDTIPQKEDSIDEFVIDDITIRVDLHDLHLSYYRKRKELFRDRVSLAYNLDHELSSGAYHFTDRKENEHIYGLGDKTGPVNKKGKRYRMETFDSMGFDSDSTDSLYKQIPFYICRNDVGSYGIYYDTYSNGVMDLGNEINNYYGPYKYFHCEEENLIYYVIFGSVEEIVSRFSYLTGKSMLPPKWTFMYCGSTMAYTDATDSDHRLREFLSLCEKYHLQCGGFYLSSGYTQIGEKRYVFHWNREKFPDPKGLADTFKEHGLSFLPNIKPSFLTSHPLYQEIASKGWFLHYKDGTPSVVPFWSGMGSYLDFTNPDAFDFWTECVKKNLVDLGYSSIWNDNNEYDIHDESILCHGFGKEIPACRIRPLFSMLMSMASFEAMDHTKRHMEVTRSGVIGLQRLCQTWTGDNNTSFKEFRGNHHMAMTMSLSGLTFFGQDIGGFAGPRPDKELFLRWIQYGIFTPRFVLHSWNPDGSSTMPWLYEDKIKTVEKLFHLREELVPYLYSEGMETIETYHSLIYPVFLRQEDYDEESDFFYCGKSILSCPVFDKGKKSVLVLLPDSTTWWLRGRRPVRGTLRVRASIDDLPVFFVHSGSVVPLAEGKETVLHIYPLEEGSFSYHYYYDDSSLKNPYIKIEVTCNKKESVLHGVDKNQKVILHDEKKRRLTRA